MGLALAGCGGAPRPVEPRVSVPVTPIASAPAPDAEAAEARSRSPEERLRANLARAEREARAGGWELSRRIDLPGHRAAVLVFDPVPERAEARVTSRVIAVGAGSDGREVVRDSGMVDVMQTEQGSFLWDLTGDGARFVLIGLTPCAANCQRTETLVLELGAGDDFTVLDSAPGCPSCARDEDGDGIPEFETPLVSLELGGCPRVACGPLYALMVEVSGYESWNGKRFSKELALFAPLYVKRLAAARQAARAFPPAAGAKPSCPVDELRTAAELYVYGVLSGVSPDAAAREMDAVMKGRSTAPCEAERSMFQPPASWPELRAKVRAASLPVLATKRSASERRAQP